MVGYLESNKVSASIVADHYVQYLRTVQPDKCLELEVDSLRNNSDHAEAVRSINVSGLESNLIGSNRNTFVYSFTAPGVPSYYIRLKLHENTWGWRVSGFTSSYQLLNLEWNTPQASQ